MGRIDKLAERYARYVALPWATDLAGAERAIFVVYDKSDERRLRARKGLFELATKEAGHGWLECDLTAAFAEWMAGIDYRDSYFEAPEDLDLKLDDDFAQYAAGRVRAVLWRTEADAESVTGVFGVASLFGFLRLSALMRAVEQEVKGRIAVFFPGEHEENQYRLMDARDGWNYLAVPITAQDEQ